MVQMCLKDQDGVARFKSEMRALAEREHMRYIDDSGDTQRELKSIGATEHGMHSDGGLIYIGVEGDDGLGLTAGNMGLDKFEVAVGFSSDAPVDKAQHFADRVVARLKSIWPVTTVPGGRGALPDPACRIEVPSGGT